MRLKLDENLPASLTGILVGLGHDVDTVQMEGLAGSPDVCVWEAAQRESRALVTQDLDFSDLRRFSPGTHHGLILIRLAKPGRFALRRRIQSVFTQENIESWAGCFVVVTEIKVRIRRVNS